MRYSKKGLAIARIGGKAVSVVRYGALLVWQAVRSCFGSGWWVNEKPWLNNEAWKNNR